MQNLHPISSTWFERLCMNLISYSIVLIPIAFLVIATKKRLLPSAILSNSLIQWFVYGSTGDDGSRNSQNDVITGSRSDEDKKSLLTGRAKTDGTHGNHTSQSLDFICCLVGLQMSYLIWGLLQEKIMTTEYPRNNETQHKTSIDDSPSTNLKLQISTSIVTFHDSQFLVLINRLVAFIAAILALVYSKRKQARRYIDRLSIQNHKQIKQDYSHSGAKSSAPLYKYIYCSISNVLSSWCQYEALKYVNFPTQCLSKSCKVIPVMLMSKILLKKRYPTLDYVCAFLLALGMFVFMLNQPTVHHRSNLATVSNEEGTKIFKQSTYISGLVILALYLTFDSFTSNWQQSLYGRYDVTNWQMMAAINFYSILLTLTSLHQLGNLEPAFKLLASSSSLLRDCMIMSIMSSIGQMFVYYTIKRFGSVIFAVIMTLRQFLSILLSCTIYGHRMNLESSIGLILIFLVVGFQVWHKSLSTTNRGRSTMSSGHSTTPTKPIPEVCIEFKSLSK